MKNLISLVAFVAQVHLAQLEVELSNQPNSILPNRWRPFACRRALDQVAQYQVTGTELGADPTHDLFMLMDCSVLINENLRLFHYVQLNDSQVNPVTGYTYSDSGDIDNQHDGLAGGGGHVDGHQWPGNRIPQLVLAELDGRHHQAKCHQSQFGDKWNERLKVTRDFQDGDVKGHLIPARLCGPEEWWNLVPMATNGISALASLDTPVHRWLSLGCGQVTISVVVNYRAADKRPIGFKYCTSFVDGITKKKVLTSQAYYSNEYVPSIVE
ncbi:hypothetical protein HDE_05851 [Halotydeus destructor]|nr:hypothetical protein HDE_05851 [Halotydeus destructor]